jgi:transposase
MKERLSVGIDVSKLHLDVHIFPVSKSFRVENSKVGISQLVKNLNPFDSKIDQIVCESSGGYELNVLNVLYSAGYKIWRVNPRRVKSFIESEGILVKTDSSDARMLAMFAMEKKSSYEPHISTKDDFKLRGAIKRRSDLIGMIKAEKTRLQSPFYETEIAGIKKLIKLLESRVKKYDEKINKLILENETWKRKAQIIESIPGVGRVTAMALLSHMPELGSIGHKQAAALLGAAPYTNESGSFKGASKIKGGRPEPRRVVYMAALSAARSNPILKAFYKKLCDRGKRPKVALVAVMRKLIIMINAMIAKNEIWNAHSCEIIV